MSIKSKNISTNNLDIDESLPVKKGLNKWVAVVIAVLLLFGILFTQITEYFAGKVLVSQVESYTKGAYTLGFDDLSINWLEATIKLKGFAYGRTELSSDESKEFQFIAKDALITLDRIVNFYFEKELNVKRININAPEISYTQLAKPLKKSTFSVETGDLYKSVQGFVKSFQVDQFSVNNLHFDYSKKYDNINAHYVINDLSFSILNFHLDSTAVADKSDFFFTESVSVILKNQHLAVGDGIHEIYFDSLKLSTSDNYIELFQLKLSEMDTLNEEVSSKNVYNTSLPYIGIKGLDFKMAYQDNVLHTDSVLFSDLSVNAHLRSIKKLKNKKVVVDTAVNNRIANVILGVFERVELDHFLLSNANFEVSYGKNDTARIDNFYLNFDDYLLDSSDLSTSSYYPNFSGLKMRVDNPEFSLPNNGSLTAEVLSFSTYDSSLYIDNAILKTISLQNQKPTQVGINQIKLIGVKPRDILENGEVVLEKLIVKQPDLKIIIDDNRKENTGFDLSSVLTPKSSLIQIRTIEILEGKAELVTPNNKKSPHRVGEFNIVLNQFKLDKFQLKRKNFLYSKNVNIGLKNTQVFLKDLQHYLSFKEVNLNSSKGVLKALGTTLKPNVTDSSSLRSVVNLEADKFKIVGLDFKNLQSIQDLNITAFNLSGVNASVNLFEIEPTDQDSSKKNIGLIDSLRNIDIRNVQVDDVSLVLQKEGVSVAKFSDAYLFANHLAAHQDSLDSEVYLFFEDSLRYGLQRFMAPVIQNNHILSVQKIDRDADSLLAIEGFSIRPLPGKVMSDSLIKLTTYISELKLNDFQPVEYATTDSLKVGLIELRKPMVRVNLPLKEVDSTASFKLSPSIPLGFLNDKFNSIELAGVIIHDGNISLEKKDLKIAVRKMNLNSSGLSITNNSKWESDKFLYAKDFSFHLQQLEYQIPGLDACHHVDSISYSFRPNELTVNGIYFNNFGGNASRQSAELSLYLPYLKLIAPNIYGFVQYEKLEIDRIETAGGKLEADFFTNVSKPKSPKPLSFPNSISDSLFGLSSIAVHDVAVERMDLQMWTHYDDFVSPLEMNHFNFKIDSFHVVPGELMDSNRLFWADNMELNVKNVYTTVDKGLYEIGADEFSFSTQQDTLGIKGVSFIPTVSRYEYALHKGHRTDVFNVNVKHVGVKQVDYFELIYNKKIKGNSIIVEKPWLSILKDKRISEPPYKRKEILPQVFKQVPVSITFDSVLVDDMKIRYEEFPEHGRVSGDIMLSDMNIKATNLTNDTSYLIQDSTLRIYMNSKFLDTADLDFYLEYNMLSPENNFKMSTELGSLDGTLINRFIEPAVGAKVNSLMVDRMEMSVIGNDSIAGGRMGFYYDDLNFTFLNEETHEAKGFGTKFKSLIGNVVVKSKNKYHPFKRRSPLFFERITGKGWINYLVKIELVGLAGSAGVKKYKKDLKHANKEVWKAFDKEYKESQKAKAKAERKLAKQKKKENRKN